MTYVLYYLVFGFFYSTIYCIFNKQLLKIGVLKSKNEMRDSGDFILVIFLWPIEALIFISILIGYIIIKIEGLISTYVNYITNIIK